MGIKNNYRDVMIVDESGRIEYFSISNVDFFDLKPSELIGTKAHQHYSNLDDETSTLMRAIKYGESSLDVVQELKTSENKVVRQISDTFCIRNGEEIIGAVEFADYDEKKDFVTFSKKPDSVPERTESQDTLETFIGNDEYMRQLRNKLEKIVELDSPVLLMGETGTGKAHVARALHYSGKRKKHNFVYINCTSLPENLFESILFGVKKGAFTDAAERDGLFFAANNGTVFLDEIQAIPLSAQGKLLRVLEEKRIRPIGGEDEIPVDVRIVASCNMDLDELLESNQLRRDLYYRLAVIQLEMPPLREHKDDIMLVVKYFIDKFNREIGGKEIKGVDRETEEFFRNYDWPGNVRELRNILESAFYTAEDDVIRFADIKERFETQDEEEEQEEIDDCGRIFLESGEDLKTYMARFQKNCIAAQLAKDGGDIKKAAKALGLTEQMMKYNINKFGIGQQEK